MDTNRLDSILGRATLYRDRVPEIKETILANVVMVGEIPAPTFGEAQRVEFLRNRFLEHGLASISVDEAGNVASVVEGRTGERTVLVLAHTDTVFGAQVNHAVRVLPDTVRGPGLGDNSLGAAFLATLPALLERLELRLDSNLILLGTTRSLGRGDLGGLRFFLDNARVPVDVAFCVEGVELGRLSYYSIGMLRCEIRCQVPEEYDWTRFGAGGAIVALNEVIDHVVAIPVPKRPRTSVNLGAVEGGTSHGTVANEAVLKLEIRSESEEMVRSIHGALDAIVAEVASRSGAEITMDIVARREPHATAFSSPLPQIASRAMRELGVHPRILPSTSELALLLERGVPAVTVGLSHSEHRNTPEEAVRIEPMFSGIAQLMCMLEAVDGGCCDGR